MADLGEAQELEEEADPNGQRRLSKNAWRCLFSSLALALIGPGTGSVPSWRTLVRYEAIRPCPCFGLVLALTFPNWLAWFRLV